MPEMIASPVDCGEGCCCNATLLVVQTGGGTGLPAQVILRATISANPPSDADTPPSSWLIPVIAKHMDGSPDMVWNPAAGAWF